MDSLAAALVQMVDGITNEASYDNSSSGRLVDSYDIWALVQAQELALKYGVPHATGGRELITSSRSIEEALVETSEKCAGIWSRACQNAPPGFRFQQPEIAADSLRTNTAPPGAGRALQGSTSQLQHACPGPEPPNLDPGGGPTGQAAGSSFPAATTSLPRRAKKEQKLYYCPVDPCKLGQNVFSQPSKFRWVSSPLH
jgi:hypothetical protein